MGLSMITRMNYTSLEARKVASLSEFMRTEKRQLTKIWSKITPELCKSALEKQSNVLFWASGKLHAKYKDKPHIRL